MKKNDQRKRLATKWSTRLAIVEVEQLRMKKKKRREYNKVDTGVEKKVWCGGGFGIFYNARVPNKGGGII